MAQRYHQRPSAFLGISDAYQAYTVDQAIMYRAVMEEAKKQANAPMPPPAPRKQNTMVVQGGRLFGSFSGKIGEVIN
jgi:hypothetical protein